MAKTTERETYNPQQLKADFPALVTALVWLNDALYVFVVDQKAQTKIKNLSYGDNWTCGGYGVTSDGSYMVRFVQLKGERE